MIRSVALIAVFVVALGLGGAACGFDVADDGEFQVRVDVAATSTPWPDLTPAAAASDVSDDPLDEMGDGSTDEIAMAALHCDDFGFEADEEVTFVTVYWVNDGALGDVCFGDHDDAVAEAWEILSEVSPAGQLFDLGLFAGFEPDPNEQSETLAFVNAIDDEGQQFQMSVNVDSSDVDRDAIALTLVHELTHIFTAVPFELDRFTDVDNCETWFNGEGCYADSSLMFAWIRAFWSRGLIDEIDPNRTIDELEDDGLYRCDDEPAFFGAYAASTPEEDFAEAFGAYVLQVPALNDAQQRKLDWIDERPGLREFRTQAIASGYGPAPHDFDSCGLG